MVSFDNTPHPAGIKNEFKNRIVTLYVMLDYVAYKVAVVLGGLFSLLPPEVYVWLGKISGRLLFYLDKKHRDISCRNIRFVFHKEKTPRELNRITRQAFENFGQNLFESLVLNRVDRKYINKYVRIEGEHFIDEALKGKRGLIYVTLHLGNWEISNAACGLFHKSCSVIVKEQKHSRLNELLNSYRRDFGVQTVDVSSLRDIVRALENNGIVTMVSDHGAGKGDTFIDFFGRDAPVPSGAVRMGLRFKTPLVFAYIVRTGGPYHKIALEPFDSFLDTGDKDRDIQENLRAINKKLESYIREYPGQYLWSYKRWKHSNQRSVLVLSDGKTGHLRQSEAVVRLMESSGFRVESRIIEIKFRSKFSRLFLAAVFYLCGKGPAERHGFFCLKSVLTRACYNDIIHSFADIVVSSGASTATVNLIVSAQNRARSIHIMRPGTHSIKRFDLVIMPRHDKPPEYKNIALTDGALNLMDEHYLREQSEKLLAVFSKPLTAGLKIGLLLGGDTKDYRLTEDAAGVIISQIKKASSDLGAEILVTTSRRTPPEAEEVLKKELADFPACPLLVIASENDIPDVVGGILGLCSVIIVTAESISMISEAASSGKFVLVVGSADTGRRHKEFLKNLEKQGCIYLTKPDTIVYKVKEVLSQKPQIKVLEDKEIVREKLREILQ